MSSSNAVDVCVIGAGLLGTATAYFAARAGLRVLIIEDRDLAAGASGAAFGGVSVSIYSYSSARVPAHYVELSKASLALYHELADHLGPPMDFDVPGSIDPFFDPDATEARRDRVDGLRECDVDCRLLSPEEVGDLEPALSKEIAGATYCPADGHVTPQNMVLALGKAARDLGVEIWTGTRVEAITSTSGRATGVTTKRGPVSAGWVVNTAGIGAPGLLEDLEIRLPMDCSRGQMFVTERVPRFLNTYVHNLKQTRSGTVVFGATRESGVVETATTVRGTRQVVGWAMRLVPGLASVRVLRSWSGIRPVPADGYPVIGPVDAIEGLLVAVMHRGVTLAPVIGKVLCDLMVDGKTDLDIAPYRLSRFASTRPDERALVEETYYE